MEEQTFYSAEQLAKRLQVRSTTIRAWAAEGKIPARKMFKKWVFLPDEIEAWVRGLPRNDNGLTPAAEPVEVDPFEPATPRRGRRQRSAGAVLSARSR